jgi:hypothetical protein
MSNKYPAKFSGKTQEDLKYDILLRSSRVGSGSYKKEGHIINKFDPVTDFV